MIALSEEFAESLLEEVTEPHFEEEIEEAINHAQNGYEVFEIDTGDHLVGRCTEKYDLSPEQCEAIGGHCWNVNERKHVAYSTARRKCVHCGHEQSKVPEHWEDL